jgi:hypothetical protein
MKLVENIFEFPLKEMFTSHMGLLLSTEEKIAKYYMPQ